MIEETQLREAIAKALDGVAEVEQIRLIQSIHESIRFRDGVLEVSYDPASEPIPVEELRALLLTVL